MIKYKLQQLLSVAKHWGGFAGSLSLVVVVMQNVYQRSEMANQDRIHNLELAVKEAQNACSFYESTVEGVNTKYQYLEMRLKRLENGSALNK